MLPKRRITKSRRNKRRSHHALRAVNLSHCPSCSHAKLPHAACTNCGYVNPRTKLELEPAEES